MIRRALYFLIAVLMCSCVHEFPNTNTPADVVLNIHLDISMEGQSYVNIAKEDEPATVQETRESVQSQLNADEYDVRNIIRFYRQDAKGEYDYRKHDFEFVVIENDPTLTTVTTEVKVSEGTYMIYVWRDYVKEGDNNNVFFIILKVNRLQTTDNRLFVELKTES